MDITIKELLQGKSTIIKNREFFPTKVYVEPFFEKMASLTQDFRVQVKLPDQMTLTKNDADVTFNRVLIQAVLPKSHSIDGHDEVIGLVYGLDVKKPIVKLYRGYLNSACTNLTVFNPQWLNVQDFVAGEPINYSPIKSLLEATSDFEVKLQQLKSKTIDRQLATQYLGQWIDFSLREYVDLGGGKVKIATSTPIDVYKKLFINSDGDYYIPEGIDPSLFDIYNAFTQVITNDKKDIMNRFEKTIIVNKLLRI